MVCPVVVLTCDAALRNGTSVAASAIFCISGYLARGDVAIKISISVNLILWCIYSLMIADIVSFAVNTVALVINIFVAVRLALEDHELQS